MQQWLFKDLSGLPHSPLRLPKRTLGTSSTATPFTRSHFDVSFALQQMFFLKKNPLLGVLCGKGAPRITQPHSHLSTSPFFTHLLLPVLSLDCRERRDLHFPFLRLSLSRTCPTTNPSKSKSPKVLSKARIYYSQNTTNVTLSLKKLLPPCTLAPVLIGLWAMQT